MPRMSRQSIPGRGSRTLIARRTLVLSLLAVALAAPQSRAADLDLTAPESIVRSAPFEVAPEIARVHAGDKLSGDDQAQGSWRRVQLKDGRHGFIHDADARVVAAPVVVAPVVPTQPAAATAASGPQRARVAVPPGVSNPAGLLLDFSVGAEIAVLPKLFVVIDLGYQIGFQSTTDVDGTQVDFDSRYLHIGAGLAVGL